MMSRLILSLRKAADEGLVLCWNDGRLSVGHWSESGQEMSNLRFSPGRARRELRTEDTTA